jgi:hypothetical protein
MNELDTIKKEAHEKCHTECRTALDKFNALRLAAEATLSKSLSNPAVEISAMAKKMYMASFLSAIGKAFREYENTCTTQINLRDDTISSTEFQILENSVRFEIEEYVSSSNLGTDNESLAKLLDKIFGPRK